MFNKQAKKGFTLIELLVVVLIIGILASVALPQYNKAVVRSRVATMVPMVQAVASAQERYYLENDTYASQLSELDVPLPSEACSHFNHSNYDSNKSGELLKCGDDFMIDNYKSASAVTLNYCPGSTSTWDSCKNARIVRLAYNLSQNTEAPNTRFCDVYPKNIKLANSICAGLPGFTKRNQ